MVSAVPLLEASPAHPRTRCPLGWETAPFPSPGVAFRVTQVGVGLADLLS